MKKHLMRGCQAAPLVDHIGIPNSMLPFIPTGSELKHSAAARLETSGLDCSRLNVVRLPLSDTGAHAERNF